MATVNDVERQHEERQNAQIWGDNDRACAGKITKKRMLMVTAVAGAAALALGLSVGLTNSDSDGESNRIVGQAVDPNAIGCFTDVRNNRVMTDVLTNTALTPMVCNGYCEGLDYAYYGLQWGKECWCAAENTDLAEFGTGTCDYPCAGDESLVCGGYLSFTAYDVGTDATTPTPTPPAATGCSGTKASVRFATETAYFEGGGCATLTDMYNAQSGDDGPLYVLDDADNIVDGGTPTGYWLLDRDLRVVDGVTLFVHGSAADGDADVLRIKSEGSEAFYELRAHGGSLSFKNTKVTSWDTEAGTEQETYEGGRSFINCVSEQTSGGDDDYYDDNCEGAAKNDMGECRMDIIDSTMGNLGWFDSESYGLTWKVRGFCKDLSNPDVFKRTNVYGDIQGSDIYGMYYGMYSYGHQGGVWTNNKMHDNILYGFDPHDDSDDLTIANNDVYANGNHGIIASKRCNNVVIHDNEVYDGGEGAVGIFLHRSSDDAEVYNNHVYNMQDAGLAIMESMNAKIYDNVFENVKYGMRISLGGADNYIHDNTFDSCSSSGLYTYEGSDEPYVSDGRPSANVWENNIISNTEIGVKITSGDNNVFTGNVFTGTETFEFKDTDGTEWTGNTIPSDSCLEGSTSFASGSDDVPSC